MRLYIIRHGETPWNTQLRLQGMSDTELNEKGRALAEATAQAMREIPFDLALTSPLKRAEETARIILAGRDIPLLYEPRIREISFGELEGRQLTREERENPGTEFYHFFHAPEHYRPAAGGERIQDLLARTADFLEELRHKEEWRDRTILVSTHGAASRALLAAIRHAPLSDFWCGGVPKNCAVTIADLEHGDWVIRKQDVIYYENV